MKKHILVFILLGIIALNTAQAQGIDTLLGKSQKILEKGRIFSIKGIGMAFPMGNVNEVLNPRFSSQIGLQILLKNPRYFIYPALDYVNFGYNQIKSDENYTHTIRHASAKLYSGTISFGLMNQIKNFRVFSSAGVGAGWLNEPRASVLDNTNVIEYENKSSFNSSIRLNFGADYGKRAFKIFAEVNYMLHSQKIEERRFHTVAFTIGTRTNLMRLARTVKTIKEKID